MTFDEHVQQHRNADGTFDLAAAEAARAAELASSDEDIGRLAAKAAKAERLAWENRNAEQLRKQFVQPALGPELEMDIKVKLGDSAAVRYGEMNLDRIRLRKDLRIEVDLRQRRAFDAEMTHWLETERVLPPGMTIEQYLASGDETDDEP